jgi:hypothetical protein
MTLSGRARYALALPWLLAPLAGASAGELGPTSRDAVSISITIPPHVRVSRSAAADSPGAQALCVVGSGLGDYRVRILDASGSPGGPDVDPGGPSGCGVGAAAAAARTVPADLAAGPVTILIVPD